MIDRDDADEEPASVIVETDKGKFDFNNITGAKKAELIMEGSVSVDRFISPPNMPGAKLKVLRDAHREQMEGAIKNISEGKENEFNKGDLINYRGYVTEVLDVDPARGVKIVKREGTGKVWVHHSKVEKAEVSERD